jgi:hypothetical protein
LKMPAIKNTNPVMNPQNLFKRKSMYFMVILWLCQQLSESF